jgi:hypothetical protein
MRKLILTASVCLFIILSMVTAEVYDHAYALPSIESLEESSPNKPDATTKEDKQEPFDLIMYTKDQGGKKSHKKFGTPVDQEKCVKQCTGHGECQVVFKNTRRFEKDIQNTDALYVCICHDNFIGYVCNE